MNPQARANLPKMLLFAFAVLLVALLSCVRAVGPSIAPWSVSGIESTNLPPSEPTAANYLVKAPVNEGPFNTPTPDSPRVLPTLRTDPSAYTVQAGDTMGKIAAHFNILLDELLKANPISNPDFLQVGQSLVIPAPAPSSPGPGFKVVPDSELVYGPGSVDFDIKKFIQSQGGYLAGYSEDVDGQTMNGAAIVKRVSYEYSVNPRLLLAILEYQSGWVTQANPDESTQDFPIGIQESFRKGLYRQLSYAANNLNRGFYLWRVNGIGAWVLPDGATVPIAPTINAGTAGVQQLFAMLYGRAGWEKAISDKGVYATYIKLFGNPFSRAVEPLLPEGLRQPKLQLPFEKGKVWAFTGGPHGGWGDGSAWAAIDFAPPGEALGCVQSDDWVVASGNGPVIRAGDGEVVQDLDSGGVKADGYEQTGWTILYMHIETRDRVQAGAYLKTGDRIGHPSCEGGVSTGTHTHLARRFNGEWIPADQDLPFILDGWVSRGTGVEYDGFLERNGETVEALEGRFPANSIQR